MNPRRVLLLTGVLALLGLGFALARSAGAPAAAPPASTLAPALGADRLSFTLPGFGRVAYYLDGRGSGRPLVLVTSINAAASAYEMRPLFEEYRGRRPVYLLEWPGFGSSDRLDVRYTPELMTSALRHLTSLIGADVDVVALSLGSEFAARASLAEPRIRSLALISPTGLGSAQGSTQTAAASHSQRAERLYRTLSNPLWAGALYRVIASRPSIRYFLSGSFQGPPDEGLIRYSFLSSHQPGARFAPLAFIGGLLFTPDAYGELYRRLSVPVLVLYDQDRFVNFDRLPEFAARSGVRAVRIAPTRGLPQFEQLGQVRAALDEFWATPGGS